jgi:hypothetical protein
MVQLNHFMLYQRDTHSKGTLVLFVVELIEEYHEIFQSVERRYHLRRCLNRDVFVSGRICINLFRNDVFVFANRRLTLYRYP